MTAEPEQTDAPLAGAAGKAAGAKAGSKPRYGIPVWRVGKPDAFLAASVDVARAAVEGIASPEQVGPHLAAKSEGDRLVTHLFEAKLPGYGGWQWYAVLTRNSRSKVVTVDELGLLPSEDSILAPEWVPWAERVRPEDAQQDEARHAEAQPGDAPQADAGQVEAQGDDASQDSAQGLPLWEDAAAAEADEPAGDESD